MDACRGEVGSPGCRQVRMQHLPCARAVLVHSAPACLQVSFHRGHLPERTLSSALLSFVHSEDICCTARFIRLWGGKSELTESLSPRSELLLGATECKK